MIRTAREKDLAAIDHIYNQAISAGFHTAHLSPLSSEQRMQWFLNHSKEEYPVYLFEEDDKVLGWASLSHYRKGREGLAEVAELSFYVDFDHHGEGIGSRLVDYCLKQAPGLNKRVLLAIIIEGNRASIGLLEKFGFERWGYLPEVIHHQEEKRGQVYMGKIIRKL